MVATQYYQRCTVQLAQPAVLAEKQGLAFAARHAAQSAHLAEISSSASTIEWECRVLSEYVSVKQVRSIYAARHHHLGQFTSAHAQRLRQEVLALLEALSKCSEDNARLWMFNGPEGLQVFAWDDPRTERLFGCVKVYDRRALSDEEWQELWGEKA